MQDFIFLYCIFCIFFSFLFNYLFVCWVLLFWENHILTPFHATDFLVLHHTLREFDAILGALLSSAYLVQSMLAC